MAMVFRKRGVILVNESWSYNGNVIEIVEQFNYLSFVISTNGSVKKCIDMLAVNARTSMRSLFSIMRGMDIPLDIKLNLCDAYVSPILCYSSEICRSDRACTSMLYKTDTER